jgi:hypothetical protein
VYGLTTGMGCVRKQFAKEGREICINETHQN